MQIVGMYTVCGLLFAFAWKDIGLQFYDQNYWPLNVPMLKYWNMILKLALKLPSLTLLFLAINTFVFI